jgi:hypothetical protein
MRPRLARTMAVVLCGLGLAGCGGSGSSSNPMAPSTAPQTSTTAPVTTVLLQGSYAGLPAEELLIVPAFTTTAAGKLEIVLDWTFASNDLDILLMRGACDPTATTLTCDVLDEADSTTAKPERLVINALPAGTYTLLILNYGPAEESLSFQILHTR